MTTEPECTCSPVPEHLWTTHYGAVDPATQIEYEPTCAAHGLPEHRIAALEQECRDRECTEQDVRARLADAEKSLARVRAAVEAIMGPSDDLRDRATCESIWLDLCAVLDGKP